MTARINATDIPGYLLKKIQLESRPPDKNPSRKRETPDLNVLAPTLRPFSISFVLTVVIPIKLARGQNEREFWAAKHKRVASERQIVAAYLMANSNLRMLCDLIKADAANGIVVRMTRLGGRKLDYDNNIGGMKAVQDTIAEAWLHMKDNDPCLTFMCEQEPKGKAGVRVEIWNGGGE